MKNESKTERQLVQELIELRQQIVKLEKAEAKRKQTEEALRESEKRYKEVVESASEIIHTTDIYGKFTFANTAALKAAGTSLEEIKQLNYPEIIHPDHRQRLSEIYINQFRERKATIYVEFPILSRSGEVIWLGQNSSLMMEGKKVVGFHSVARDITTLKKAEETLRRSEEEAKRLAKENTVMAEIGRIISSTLNIEEVYEYFTEEVRKIIPADGITIGVINYEDKIVSVPYGAGLYVPGRRKDDVVPLAGTATEEVVRTRSSLLIQEKSEEVTRRFPGLLSYFQSGGRSLLIVPLISRDEVIGVILFLSKKVEAYSAKDLNLAERVGNQIAGAVANAQLYLERLQAEEEARRSEEEAKRLAQENALVAEIGRIIGSAPNIDEVFERFSKAVAKLIPFDRIVVILISPQKDTTFVRYEAGIDVPNRRAGEYVPIAGTAAAECLRLKSSLLIQPGDVKEMEEWIARVPRFLANFEAGIRSAILVPLIAEDQVIGVLSLRSTKTKAYTEQDVRLTESIASQIAGAVANAQLYLERLQAEEAARRSEEEAKRLAQENAVVAEIGRIISSTPDIEDIYERFAEQARQLIAFDYICISTVNQEKGTLYIPYVSGYVIPGRVRTDVVSLAGSFTEEAARTRSSQLIQTEDAEEVAARFPGLLPFLQHGFRSFMAIPLISNDQVIGVLCVYSIKSKAYKETEVNLAEQIANQIAGAIANAQLFLEHKRAEEEREKLVRDLQKALSEVKKLSGFLPICASCKKIRDDKGYWNQVEVYIRDHSEAEFSHGICPDCMKKLYPDFYKEDK